MKPGITSFAALDAIGDRFSAMVHLWMGVWDRNTGKAPAPYLDPAQVASSVAI